MTRGALVSRLSGLAALWVLAACALLAEPLGTISGTVMSGVNGTALAGSKVTLCLVDGSPIRSVRADHRGHYEFDQLPAGSYLVQAGHTNYSTGRYGQKSWNQAGQPISLLAGSAFSADILLHRLGVITGTVLDENGEGIPNYSVVAVTAEAGRINGRVSSAGVTDDRGAFRIPGLKPGRYYVSTSAHQMDDGTSYLPTYSPSTLNRSESRPIVVDVDQENGGVQIQPLTGRLVHLAGTLVGAARGGDSPARVTLFHEEESRDVQASPDGHFQFANVVPGHYTLLAELALPHGGLAAYQPIDILDDRDGLSVNLVPAPEVTVRLADEAGADLNDPQVLLFLSRIENGARTQPQRIEQSRKPGVFVADGLMPGEWRFFVVAPESSVVEAITADGKDALGGLSLMPNQKVNVTIRLRRQAARLHGKVARADGSPAAGLMVFAYPLSEQNRLRLGGYRQVRTNVQGEYQFNGMAEGDYLVFATAAEDFQPDEQAEALKSRLRPVHVGHSGETSADLPILE